jgi:hypothetical protein
MLSTQMDWCQVAGLPGHDAGEPSVDVRGRQVKSLVRNRGHLIEYFYSTGELEARGIPTKPWWPDATSASTGGSGSGGSFDGHWLDPRSPRFDPTEKYFTVGKTGADDTPGAKALERAATGRGEVEFEHIAVSTAAGGAPSYSVEVRRSHAELPFALARRQGGPCRSAGIFKPPRLSVPRLRPPFRYDWLDESKPRLRRAT